MPNVIHRHAEAFRRMLYRCQACEFEEWLWNSRDGVTPFGIDCRRCGKDEAVHIEWHGDVYAPDYIPQLGERYFRDGTPEEARAIMRRRLENGRGTPYEIPEEEWAEFIEQAIEPQYMELPGSPSGSPQVPVGEFAPGWPQIAVQEMLPEPFNADRITPDN